MEIVLAALIAAVPASMMAWVQLRQLRTGNGKKLGELTKQIHEDLVSHTAQDDANFRALHAEVQSVKRGSRS